MARICVIGNGTLAVKCLDILLGKGHEVALVIAGKADTKQSSWQLSLQNAAGKIGIKVLTPSRLADIELDISASKPDIVFSIHCDMIIPKEIIQIPKLGVVNFHFALLPRHRGMFPSMWAILEGDSKAGVTLHYVTPGIDDGSILTQAEVEIKKDSTSREIYDQTLDAALELFSNNLNSILSGSIAPKVQDKEVCYHGKDSIDFSKLTIDWNTDALLLDRRIRALSFDPYQHMSFNFKNNKIDVVKCELGSASANPGKILNVSPYLEVAALSGSIIVKTVKLNGADTGIKTFVSKFGLKTGDVL